MESSPLAAHPHPWLPTRPSQSGFKVQFSKTSPPRQMPPECMYPGDSSGDLCESTTVTRYLHLSDMLTGFPQGS